MRIIGRALVIAVSALIAAHSPGQIAAQVDDAHRNDRLIRVQRYTTPEWVLLDRRTNLREGRPELRGFRARILPDATDRSAYDPWPMLEPSVDRARPVWRAADRVARRLASDGLLPTLAEVLRIWPASEMEKSAAAPDRAELAALRRTGLPVDLLRFFAADPESPHAIASIVGDIEARLASGATLEALKDDLARTPFRFRASVPGFRIATESGENEIGFVRAQLTSGEYWSGRGDGGCLDLVRQLVELLPDADFVASIEDKHVDRFLETARDWPIARADRFTLVPESWPVAQWAQDDGKPGWIELGEGQPRELVTLVPRYASRGEDGAIFVPGETFLMDGFAATGKRVVQSPLLFQGGNVIAVRAPATGERILLIGEAEIYRNTALGLTRDQVLEAFRIEFGVDRCAVLPAASFHIDRELCARAVGQELLVFVNESSSAARIAFDRGLQALEQHGDLDPSAAHEARTKLAAKHTSEAVEIASRALVPHLKGPGRFAESFAQAFSTAPWDSGVGNLETFLLALDLLQSETVRARTAAADPNTAAYLESLRLRAADRLALAAALADLDFRIVRVPSFSDGDRGLNYVNGIHARGVYLMPAHGGLYASLDRAAQFVFEAALGSSVKVLPVNSSESQRRSGAVHCSVSVCAGP
jgi:hypothetical protein